MIDENYVFPIYISQSILQQIVKTCKNNKYEVFGFLVGKLHQWKGQNYIIIEDYIIIEFIDAEYQTICGITVETSNRVIRLEAGD